MLNQTIAAIATAPGQAGIGIIRLSGDQAQRAVLEIFRDRNQEKLTGLKPRYMHYGYIVDANQQIIDQVLAVYMPSPNSYTGEDVAEIQAHGGQVVLQAIFNQLLKNGVRVAAPGEFTQRAFVNGKLDLNQAEAIIDIIQAKSTAALKISNRQLQGALGQEIAGIADQLLDILAQIEVIIDYPEEEDHLWQQLNLDKLLQDLDLKLAKILHGADQGKIYQQGVSTAIVGPANAGKSTLLNALLREDRAIVTEIAGTTRDTIEEPCVFQGVPFSLIDTAGIRETTDLVEAAGIARSREKLAAADLVLAVFDAGEPLSPSWQELLQEIAGKKVIILLNKWDRIKGDAPIQVQTFSGFQVLKIAARDHLGLEELEAAMVSAALNGGVSQSELKGLVNDRQRSALERSKEAILEALTAYETGVGMDMIAIDVENAWRALGEITGVESSDEIITRVFSRFCLGK